MSQAYDHRVTNTQRRTIEAHYNVLVEVLDLEEPFAADDYQEGPSNSQLGHFRQNGVIVVDSVETDGGDKWQTYRISPNARDVLDEIRESVATACDHRGVVNLGDNQFSCGADHCDERFGPATARQAMEGL